MADSRTGIYKTSLEHLIVLESKEVLHKGKVMEVCQRHRDQLKELPMAKLEKFDQQ